MIFRTSTIISSRDNLSRIMASFLVALEHQNNDRYRRMLSKKGLMILRDAASRRRATDPTVLCKSAPSNSEP
jgi:hypothetical protein